MTPPPDTAPPLRLPDWLVKNRNFVCLWFAYGVAAMGDHLSELALLNGRGGMQRDDATRVQALITFGFFLPFVILGPLAGWWSDRFSRKWTMIAADVLRAAIVFNLVFIVVQLERWLEPERFPNVAALVSPFEAPTPAAPPRPGVGDFSIVVPLMIVGALAAFFSPARQALLPTLIRDDQLVRANAMINALGTIGGILGAVIGGFLVDHVAREWNFHLNAVTFLLSAMFVTSIAMSRSRAVAHPPLAGVWAPVRDGFRYVRRHRRVLQLILLGTVFWAVAGVVASIVPAVVVQVFGGKAADIGVYRGLLVIGLAIGAAVMSIIGPALPMQLAVLGGLAGGAFWLVMFDAAVFFCWPPWIAGTFLVLVGGAGAALLVTIMSTTQYIVPDSRRGRVFGVMDMATMGAMVAATGVLGLPEIPHLDRYIPALVLICAVLMGAGLIWAWLIYQRRQFVHGPAWLAWQVNCFYLRLARRLERVGHCTAPRTGRVLIAANGGTGVDALAILATCPRPVGFVVRPDHSRTRIARALLRWIGSPVVDGDAESTVRLDAGARLLEQGGCLAALAGVEGESSAPPASEIFADVAALALRSSATLIPASIGLAADRGGKLRLRVRYGRPLDLAPLRGRESDPAAAVEIGGRIAAELSRLDAESAGG